MNMTKKDFLVLVIEDELLLLQAIKTKLQKKGVSVMSASLAKEAYAALKQSEKNPDAIWLDYYLPDENGLEIMHRLKKNPKWATIPVYLVSNSASEKKVHDVLELGAKEYLTKAEHRLEDIVDLILKKEADGKKSTSD